MRNLTCLCAMREALLRFDANRLRFAGSMPGFALAVALSACAGSANNPTPVVANGATDGTNPAPAGDTTIPTVSITSPKANVMVAGTTTIVASASDNVGVVGVQFRVNGANVGAEDVSSPYSMTLSTTGYPDGSYTLTALARDAAGNKTTSAPINVTVNNTAPPPADTNPPSVPTGLSANAVASDQVNLSWSKSADNVGVAGYRIYRNGTEIGTTTQNTYTAAGLAAQTSYTFQVAAYDAAGNTSSRSISVSATTFAATVGTSLSDLAARLKPGEWGELSTMNINATLGETSGNTASGDIITYVESMAWDPITRRVYFLGSDANQNPENYISYRFVSYSETTNSWSILPKADWFYGGRHAYDHNALDSVGRRFYHLEYSTFDIHRYELDTGLWTQLPSVPLRPDPPLSSIAFVPELGGLVYMSDADGEVLLFKESEGKWSNLGKTSGLNYHSFAEYNPVHKVTVFGGGNDSSKMYKLSAAATITPLKDAPLVLSLPRMEFTVDPVSGDFLVLGQDKTFRAYDVTTDSWRALPSPPASLWNVDEIGQEHGYVSQVAGVPINTYGVVMFVTCDGPDCRVNIYKHAGR